MNKLYYFTGTGNSYEIAKKMASELQLELGNIAAIIDEDNLDFEGDMLGLVFPLYYLGIPQMVGKFLNKLNIKNNPYIFAIATCGGSGYGIPFDSIENILKGKSGEGEQLKVSYSEYIQMPSNYLRFSRGNSPEKIREIVNMGLAKLENNIQEIAVRKKIEHQKVLSNFLSKTVYMFWLSNLYKADRKFIVKDNCISCGLCVTLCPNKNIELLDGRPTWKGQCQDCMACLNLCPIKSIDFKSFPAKGRYCNPDIKIDELKYRR